MANSVDNIFTGQKTTRDITKYTLTRGVADFSNLAQFDNFETGYGYLFVLKIPEFLRQLENVNSEYKTMIDNYWHLLEYDFRSFEGLQDIEADTNNIEDGINTLPIITKVNEQSGSQFTLRYNERSGSVFTKVHELYLRGIKDPRTQVKRYNGLLKTGDQRNQSVIEAGYENETFQFLYIVTDNTVRDIEKAYLLVSCQPTSAETSMYNSTKGEIAWHELSITFNGYPITGPAITAKAQKFIDWLNEHTVMEEVKFGYQALNEMKDPGNTGGVDADSPVATW